jgi:hypothetical protein
VEQGTGLVFHFGTLTRPPFQMASHGLY